MSSRSKLEEEPLQFVLVYMKVCIILKAVKLYKSSFVFLVGTQVTHFVAVLE